MSARAAKSQSPKAYLLKGDDEFTKARELESLLKTLVSNDFADFDLEQMEGDTATSDRVMAGLNVPPFGSTKRVVLVRYANKMDPAEQEKLASRLERVPESGCLVLVNPAAEKVDGKPRKGSEVIGDLSRAVRKVGEVRELGGGTSKEKTERARPFAQGLFTTAGKKIDAQTLSLFIQRVGVDFAVLATEAQKLIDYSGDQSRITADDVTAVTSETPDEKIFKLIDAVAAKSKAAALKYLDELFESGTTPDADAPKTLSNLARQFRLLWQAKLLTEAGVRSFDKASVPDSVKSKLPSEPSIVDVVTRQRWQQDRLVKQARPFTRNELARCFQAVARADAMLKGAEGDIDDPKLVMELLVIELASKPRA